MVNKEGMKVISFNVNGIRARLHQLSEVITIHRPLVIGLQETKVQDSEFPVSDIEDMGYSVMYHGQKSHYGVAILYKSEAVLLDKGFPDDNEDAQKRMISLRCVMPGIGNLTVINGYFPQGESRSNSIKFAAKEQFYSDLLGYLQKNFSPDDEILIMGDFNVAPEDNDIGIGEVNARRWLQTGKCSFLPEEREWFSAILDWGFLDGFRLMNPDVSDRFSWFDYRSRGFEDVPKRGLRIDNILITRPLRRFCSGFDIDYGVRAMERPSDHAPIWIEFRA